MAAADISGLLVNWKSIDKQAPKPGGAADMGWDAEVRFRGRGLVVDVSVRSDEVLECMPFTYHEQTPIKPYWSQSVARAEVRILHEGEREEFETECVLETMVSGGTGNLRS